MHRIATVTRCVLSYPRASIVRGNSVRSTSVKRRNKIVQEITRNVANIFICLCNNSDRTWFFNTLISARSLGRCWKPRPLASVFNTSNGTWRMLMHEKPCLIPILIYGDRRQSPVLALTLETTGLRKQCNPAQAPQNAASVGVFTVRC